MLSDLRLRAAALMRSPAVAAIAVAAAIWHLGDVIRATAPHSIPNLDFSSFYVWAWAIRHQLDPYTTDMTPYAKLLHLKIDMITRADFPPTFLLMFEPFTFFAPMTAYWIWCGLNIAMLLGSMALIVMPQKSMPTATALIIIAIGTFYRPIKTHFIFQQAQIMVLFMLVLIWWELKRGDELKAGALLGVAGLLKVFPLFMMLYLACMRKWRALLFTIVVLMGGFALTLAIVGPRSFGFFNTVVRHVIPVTGIPETPIVGLGGSIVRLYQHFDPRDSVRSLVALRNIIVWIGQLALLWITAVAILRSRVDSLKVEYAFGLCIAAMTLWYPNSWSHYMVMLLFPLCQIAVAAEVGTAPASAVILAVISYALAELSFVAADKSFRNNQMNLGLWLIEGMFFSTIITYVATYVLTTNGVRAKAAALAA